MNQELNRLVIDKHQLDSTRLSDNSIWSLYLGYGILTRKRITPTHFIEVWDYAPKNDNNTLVYGNCTYIEYLQSARETTEWLKCKTKYVWKIRLKQSVAG